MTITFKLALEATEINTSLGGSAAFRNEDRQSLVHSLLNFDFSVGFDWSCFCFF